LRHSFDVAGVPVDRRVASLLSGRLVVVTLQDAVAEIGRAMVACSSRCAVIYREQMVGSLPRCLVLEERDASVGCAIVGINPGRASRVERSYYMEQGCTYESVVAFWRQTNGFRHPYYTRLRKLADQLGLSGSILWTELISETRVFRRMHGACARHR